MKRSERKRYFAACGQKRRQNKLLIRAAMLHNGHTEASLARELGIASQTVCRVIGGVLHSEDILAALVEAGVPEEYLCDPRKAGDAKPYLLSTLVIATLYGVHKATVLRWAEHESWASVPRKGKGGGADWLISSLPEHRQLFLNEGSGHAV